MTLRLRSGGEAGQSLKASRAAISSQPTVAINFLISHAFEARVTQNPLIQDFFYSDKQAIRHSIIRETLKGLRVALFMVDIPNPFEGFLDHTTTTSNFHKSMWSKLMLYRILHFE